MKYPKNFPENLKKDIFNKPAKEWVISEIETKQIKMQIYDPKNVMACIKAGLKTKYEILPAGEHACQLAAFIKLNN